MVSKLPDPDAPLKELIPLYEDFPKPPARWPLPIGIALILCVCVGIAFLGYQYHKKASAPDEQTYLKQAEAAVAAGRSADAIIYYRSALALNGRNGEAREQLGMLYIKSEQFDLAQKEIDKAIELGTDVFSANIAMIKVLIAKGEFENAMKKIALAKQKARQSAELAVLEAEALLGKGDRVGAKLILDAARPMRASDQVDVLVGQAKLATLDGDVASALAKLDEALALDPANSTALVRRGELRDTRNELIGAEADYRQALSIQPRNLRATAGLVDVMTRQGRIAEAEPIAKEAFAKYGDTQLTEYLRGLVAYLKGDYDQAIEDFTKVVQTVPHPQALLALADIREQRGELAQAEEYLAHLNEVNGGNYLPSVKRLARVQLALNAPARAVITLSRHVPDADKDYEFWALLADAKRGVGDVAGAKRAAERVHALEPDAPARDLRDLTLKVASGKTKEAINELRAASGSADTFQTQVLLLYAYLKTNDNNDAQGLARTLLEKPGNAALKQSLLGLTLRANGNLDGARQAYEAALAADPAYAPAEFNLGELELGAKNLDAAREHYRAAITANPRFLPAYMQLASIASNKGDDAEVMRILGEAVTAQPTAYEPRAALAQRMARAGKLAEAERLLQEADRATTTDPRFGLALAELLTQTGRSPQALDLFPGLAKRFPTFNTVRQRWLTALIAAEQWPAARDLVMAALSKSPTDAQALLLATRIERASGNFDAALAYVKEFERLYPQDPRAASAKADTLFASGHADAAREVYEEWLKGHPQDVSVRLALASMEDALGRTDAAIVGYQAVLKLEAENPVALNNLAYALFLRGDPQARSLAERAQRAAPDVPQFVDTLGWILLKTGSPREALDHLHKASEAAPQDALIRYHYAAALAANDRKGDAIVVLDAVLSDDKMFSERAAAETLRRELKAGG